tara:strand:+ start:57026 stop:57250 length:225 start_codon:yes stop_codon:yes gene_type:complete
MKITLEEIITKKVLIRAVKTSLIVGTILNLINQGDVILALDYEQINLGKMALTYSVPFFVSGFSIARTNSLSQK